MSRLRTDMILFVFASVCDVVVTYLTLFHFNYSTDFLPHTFELNPIARLVIKCLGLAGMIAYKTILVGLILSIAHYVEGKERVGLTKWITPKVILRTGILYTFSMLLLFLIMGVMHG